MDDQMAYVAFCKGCGVMVAATLDNTRHKEDVAQHVAEWITDDLRVEHIDAEKVRELFATCTCDPAGQLPLFDMAESEGE